MPSSLAEVFVLCGVLHFSTAIPSMMGADLGAGLNYAAKAAMEGPLLDAVPGGKLVLGGTIAAVSVAQELQKSGDYKAAMRAGGDSIAKSVDDMASSNPLLGAAIAAGNVVKDVSKGKDIQSALKDSADDMVKKNKAFQMVKAGSDRAKDLSEKDLKTVMPERDADMASSNPALSMAKSAANLTIDERQGKTITSAPSDSATAMVAEKCGGDAAKMASGAMNDLQKGGSLQSVVSKNGKDALENSIENHTHLQSATQIAEEVQSKQITTKRTEPQIKFAAVARTVQNAVAVTRVAQRVGAVAEISKRVEVTRAATTVQSGKALQVSGRSNISNSNTNSKNMPDIKKMSASISKFNTLPSFLHKIHPKSIVHYLGNVVEKLKPTSIFNSIQKSFRRIM